MAAILVAEEEKGEDELVVEEEEGEGEEEDADEEDVDEEDADEEDKEREDDNVATQVRGAQAAPPCCGLRRRRLCAAIAARVARSIDEVLVYSVGGVRVCVGSGGKASGGGRAGERDKTIYIQKTSTYRIHAFSDLRAVYGYDDGVHIVVLYNQYYISIQ